MAYTYFVCELTSGRLVAELPLTEFSGERNLAGDGAMTARLLLADKPAEVARDYLEHTDPGRFTIVAERDEQIVGEWIIWKRSRNNDSTPISLFGNELLSYLKHRQIDTRTFKGADQIAIAETLAAFGFGAQGPGDVVVEVGGGTPSGMRRDRAYLLAEATVGQRLAELGAVLDGFDMTIVSSWVERAGVRYIRRQFRTFYPRAGLDLPFTFDMPAPGGRGGNLLSFALDEDATTLADQALAIGGSGEGAARLVGRASGTTLVGRGYPWLEVAGSWTDVITQPTIDAKARDLLADARTPILPPTMRVLADGEPALGDYQLGDRVTANVAPSPNFPAGYTGRVRILGWTVSPPREGVETVDLVITDPDDLPGDGEDD